MDINIINDRKINNFKVCIRSESDEMGLLLRELVSRYAVISDKSPDLFVICAENEVPLVKGPCIFVGKGPEILENGQEILSRPMDIDDFIALLSKMLSKNTEKRDSGWGIDPARRVAVFEDKEIGLTKREFQLYSLLLSHEGEAVSREEIERVLWNGEVCGNSSDVYICYLRKKLEGLAGAGVLISVRGQGYMLK